MMMGMKWEYSLIVSTCNKTRKKDGYLFKKGDQNQNPGWLMRCCLASLILLGKLSGSWSMTRAAS